MMLEVLSNRPIRDENGYMYSHISGEARHLLHFAAPRPSYRRLVLYVSLGRTGALLRTGVPVAGKYHQACKCALRDGLLPDEVPHQYNVKNLRRFLHLIPSR